MNLPTPDDVRKTLEGYAEITEYTVSNEHIQEQIDFAVLQVESRLELSLSEERTVTKHLSGAGRNYLILGNPNIKKVVSVTARHWTLGAWDYNQKASRVILYNGVFPRGSKNIEVEYIEGYIDDIPKTITTAIKYIAAGYLLASVSGREGGKSSMSLNGISKSYTDGHKYSRPMKQLFAKGIMVLDSHIGRIVGT